MIDLEERYLQALKEILSCHVPQAEVRMFGSRVRGTARRFSDIDLVVVDSLSEQTLSALRDAFADSDIPYRVDVLDWQAIAPEFQKTIEEQGFAVIQERSQGPPFRDALT